MPNSIITMACVTLDNTISFTTTSMEVVVHNDSNKMHFIPYVSVSANIMRKISEKFNIVCEDKEQYVQLFSLPDTVMDKECSSTCTASLWSRIQGKNASLVGEYKFAVEVFDNASDWYLVATCNHSVLYLD